MTLQNTSRISPYISNRIDVIRGMAALGVIYGHSIYGFAGLSLELNGAFWVWIFLPISGYLVGRGFLPGGYGLTVGGYARFLTNRSLRIVPLAYIALGIGIVASIASGEPLPATALQQFLFVPPLNLMSLCGPLWTVAAEMQFYVFGIVLVPVAIYAAGRGGAIVGILLLVLALIGGQQWITWVGDNASQPRTFIGNIAFFVFGIFLACPTRLRLVAPSVITGILVVICVAVAWYLQNYQANYFWAWGGHAAVPLGGGAAIALVITFVVLALSPPPSSPSNVGSTRAPIGKILSGLAWCGRYTYGIYVWHAIIAVLNNKLLHIAPGLKLLVLLLLAVALAPISYRWLERPFLRFKMARSSSVAGIGTVSNNREL